MKYMVTCIFMMLALSACSTKTWNNITDGITEIGKEGAKAVNSEG